MNPIIYKTPQVFGRFELLLKLPLTGRGAAGFEVAGRGFADNARIKPAFSIGKTGA